MPFASLVEAVIKLGLAPVLLLYMVWYFTRQFDRLVTSVEVMGRGIQKIGLHLDVALDEEDTPGKRSAAVALARLKKGGTAK